MECKCTFHQRMNGDGCDICNPAKALEICRENYAELERAARRLVEAVGWRYECVSCQFDMIGKLGKSVARRELTRTVSLASKDVFGALAEVEALLKEKTK